MVVTFTGKQPRGMLSMVHLVRPGLCFIIGPDPSAGRIACCAATHHPPPSTDRLLATSHSANEPELANNGRWRYRGVALAAELRESHIYSTAIGWSVGLGRESGTEEQISIRLRKEHVSTFQVGKISKGVCVFDRSRAALDLPRAGAQ